MPDWPQLRPDAAFRSDHDPAIAGSATAPAKPKPPLWKRVRAWTIILALYAVIVGMAVGGIVLVRSASHSGHAWDDRLYNLILALGLMAPLAWVVWFFVRNRWKTGRWAESREQREQRREQCRVRSGGGGACAPRGMRPWSWSRNLLYWAGYTAFEPSCGVWQRIAGWTILIGEALLQVTFTAFGVICIGAAFDGTDTVGQRLLFIGVGLLIFILPIRAVRVLVLRKRAGTLRVSPEEFGQVRAQRAAWADRESRKPLRSKIFTTVFVAALYGWWWMRATLRHAQHPHESWITLAIYTPFAIYLIWVQFRRPRTAVQPTEPDAQPAPAPQG